MSLGSSEIVGFTWIRPGNGSVHKGSLGFSLRVFVFIQGRWVHWGFVRCRLVHSGTRMGSLGSFGAIEFTRVRAGGRWFHQGSLGSLGFAMWSFGSLWFALGVVVFIRVHLGSHCGSLGLSLLAGFTPVRPGGRSVNLGSFGSLGFALGFVGFIQGRWVHSCSPLGSLSSSGKSLGFAGSSTDHSRTHKSR